MNLQQKIARSFIRQIVRMAFDRSPESKTSSVKHILVLRLDAKLGDSIVSSFFYREVKKLKNVSVTVITVESLAALHKKDFGADRVIVTSARPRILELLKLKQQLGHVDVVLHLVEKIQPREIFFLWLTKASQVYSLDDSLRTVNKKMGVSTHGMLFAEKYCWVLEQLGVDVIQRDYIVPVLSAGTQSNKASVNIDILFNPYASRDDKSLSHEKSLELLRCLADAYRHCSIGILSSSQTKQQAEKLARDLNREHVFAIDNLTTPQSVAAKIRQAQIVVSVDTAIVHMAVGLRKRLVAIYPSVGAKHNPWLPPKSTITRLIYSTQDVNRFERYGIKDMNNFHAHDVVVAVGGLLEEEPFSLLRIKAKLISGMGVARKTLALQLPLISKGFPEISNCWPGTLNLEMETPLEVICPDHRTPPIAWTPSGIRTEVFDLVRIELDFPNITSPVPAWLYIAHDSPHRQNRAVHEVIAPKVDVSGVEYCYVRIRATTAKLNEEFRSLHDS